MQSTKKPASYWLLVSAVLYASSNTPSRADDRADFFRAFDDLSAQALKIAPTQGMIKLSGPHGGKIDLVDETMPLSLIKKVPTPVGDSKNIIKIWARLEGAGQFVSLKTYKWKPEERLYLCFEAAVPVHFALHYLKSSEDISMVLPTEQNDESHSAIPVRRRYELPILLELEKHNEDELVALTFVVAGSPQAPRMRPGPNNGVVIKGVANFREDMDKLFKENRNKGFTYKGLQIAPPRESSTDPNDVAVIVASDSDRGTMEVLLRKRKP